MWTPLGDVARISAGYPFRSRVEAEEGGDIVLVQIKDIDVSEGVSATGTITLRNEGGKYEKYLLQEGDVLFQSRGSRHPVAVIAGGLRAIAATGVHVIRPERQAVLPHYLAWFLNHPRSQSKLTSDVARGTYIPFVSKGDLAAFPVPTPPLEIQERIIEIDRLRQAESHLRQRLNELTQQLADTATWTAATRQ